MLIIVDSREQLPYWKAGECARMMLNVGDYTTAELLNHFHIERKSMQDWYGTIIQNHPRFRREILRAQETKTKLVVYIEGTRKQFVNKLFEGGDRRKTSSVTLDRICTTIEKRYKLEIVWCVNREECKTKVLKRLTKEEKSWKRK